MLNSLLKTRKKLFGEQHAFHAWLFNIAALAGIFILCGKDKNFKKENYMKNTIKLYGLITLVAVIVFTMAGCKSMRLDYLETDTVDGPRQVRQGQDIDPRLITVWGIYKDGSRKVVSVGSNSVTFNKHTPGPQIVKVRVSGQEVSFQTEVMALRSLTVASPPRTTLFKQGQEPASSWPGLEIRGEWDRMGSERIDIAYCQITGYMKDQPGKQTIRVSYEGLTTTFEVDVRSMTSLQIAQPPTKLDYAQGAPLLLTGLRVIGVWEGFPAEELSVTMNDITGYNTNNIGIQHVTVTKNGRSASFDVEVMALTSIVLDKPPTKTVYKAGEPLNLTGIMVYGNYTGADPTKKRTELIPVDQLTVSGYEPNRVGKQQRVTITVRGQIANFFVDIEEAATQPPATTPQQPGNNPSNNNQQNQHGNNPSNNQPSNQPGNNPSNNNQQNRPGNNPSNNQPSNQPGNNPSNNNQQNRPGNNPPTTQTTPPANTTPTVTNVAVSPSSYSTRTNTTVQFNAAVTGSNNPGNTVTWKVSSNSNGTGEIAPRTTINANGLLTVAPNEWSTTLYVFAISTVDPTKSGVAVVTITNNNSNQGSNQGR
jgi:hypothetical protein